MTPILARLLGRLPIGWLQLTHNRGRLVAALAGVTFANVLVFVQLGILGALNTTIIRDYQLIDADIMISAADANTLIEGSNVPRQLMYRALSHPSVMGASPLFIGNAQFNDNQGEITFQVMGFDPDIEGVMNAVVDQQRTQLRVSNGVLVDALTRGLSPEIADALVDGTSTTLEVAGQQVSTVGALTIGSGFAVDGAMLASDQTFLRMFRQRSAASPNHIVLTVREGHDLVRVVEELELLLEGRNANVRTVEQAATDDLIYQTTERPTGLIFGFGVIMGVIVGIVIVYQVLSTDVADHLREYATFKAMGYPQPFFLSIVFEEAIVLGILGFIPGVLISLAAYLGLAFATGLPLELTFSVAAMVFLGTVAACTASGAFATRRLASADPADLF